MTPIRSLEQMLLDNLPWNRSRIKCITRFLPALYAVQTVNLSIPARRKKSRITKGSNTSCASVRCPMPYHGKIHLLDSSAYFNEVISLSLTFNYSPIIPLRASLFAK